MKTIIAGSRTIEDPKLVWRAVQVAKRDGLEISEVVSGAAKGVDSIAEEGARSKGMPTKTFEVPSWLWDVLPKKAALLRNQAMANYADALIALADDQSETGGTWDMIRRAQKAGLKMYTFRVTAEDRKMKRLDLVVNDGDSE